MPVDFNTMAPLLNHILETSHIDIFLTNLTLNAEIKLPTLLPIHCKSAIVTCMNIADIERLFKLSESDHLKIHSIAATAKQYNFKFNLKKRLGRIRSNYDSVVDDFMHYIELIPGGELVSD
jgi:hypothetical protein